MSVQTMYQPRINRALEMFKNAWNSRSTRTIYNATPRQLFTEGALRMSISGLDMVEYLPETEFLEYGMEEVDTDDSDNSLDSDSDLEGVPVLEIGSHYSRFMEFLSNHVDPLAQSDDLAVDIYQRAMRTIKQCVQKSSS